jgi:hypothetical protein
MRAYTVQKWNPTLGKWEYLTPQGKWNTDIMTAKTWMRVGFADKASLPHIGAVVQSHEV